MKLFSKDSSVTPSVNDAISVNATIHHLEKSGDPAHHDKLEAQHPIDPVVEKRVVRKSDMHVVPLVMALYLLAYLDRSNIGNARIAGMEEDLELRTLMWKVVPPHIWGAFCVFGWGLVSTVQAGIHTWEAEMALRFFMGISEAGHGPGILYLLSFFYLRHELGLRIGFFLSAAPLASSFAGAVLFLVEGLPTVVMAVVAFFYLPDSPSKARFLNEDEKRVAIARGVKQAGLANRIGTINFKEIGQTFLDPKAWLTAFMYFSCNASFSSLPVFLPTILKEMGFTAVNAQGLTAPPFFLSFLMTILTAWIADRTQQRGITVMILSALGRIGYLMLACAKSTGARYTAVFIAASGIFPSIANILPWVLSIDYIWQTTKASDTRRGAGIMILNLVAQCGPLLGTRLNPKKQGPYYVKGQSVCAAFMFFTTLLAFSLRMLLVWENKKLDCKYGTLAEQKTRSGGVDGVPGSKDSAEAGVENYGATYRYVL
ncbi:MFS general substrate transporter [Tothia fuscella]|uniref:MFS general substrate transporter n=1 Tax=Tothia fuscella TaxID=1048955 RepID=A0A9P4NI53_9PEZI|nr:MFS general substrate transporter [Tothia fuscella]